MGADHGQDCAPTVGPTMWLDSATSSCIDDREFDPMRMHQFGNATHRSATARLYRSRLLRTLAIAATTGELIAGGAVSVQAASGSFALVGENTVPTSSTAMYETAARISCPAPPTGQTVIAQYQYNGEGTWYPYTEDSLADAPLSAPNFSRTVWLGQTPSPIGRKTGSVRFRCAVGTGTNFYIDAGQQTALFSPISILAKGARQMTVGVSSNSVKPDGKVTFNDGNGLGAGKWTGVRLRVQHYTGAGYTTLYDAQIQQRSGRWGPVSVQVPQSARQYTQITATAVATSETLRVTVKSKTVTVLVAPRSYLAMGDSYSSGEGNPPFDAGTDTSKDSCHRSYGAWPRFLSSLEQNYVQPVQNIACSGATTEAFSKSFKSELPQIQQLQAAQAPSVITITIGGNNAGFSTLLGDCYVSQCDRDGAIAYTKRWIENKERLQAVVSQILRQVRATSPNSQVYLVGYPNLVPTNQDNAVNCGWLSRSERSGLVELATAMDKSQAAAAASVPGVRYVSVLDALSGHEECTTQSYMTPVNGNPWTPTQQAGHPAAQGQIAIARVVQQYLASRGYQ